MVFLRTAFLALASFAVSTQIAHAQTKCEASPARHAVRILGTGPDGAPTDREFPFVAGERDFYQQLDNGWLFALMRAENGWSVRLYEHERVGEAIDLTSMTPPLRGAPNPRDIFGWHFRNAANTGPNEGDVNAPQELRAFMISPALAGTGGYRPPTDGAAPTPSPSDGLGWLKILDYGLAGLKPGERARMNYLKFDACLTWPRSDAERDWLLDRESLDFTDEDREIFGACGLDLQTIELNATYAPRTLGGDMDGDGALDQIAQIRRKSDGKRGLALCRAGERLSVIGLDGAALDDLSPGYIDQLEAWHWVEKGQAAPAHLQSFGLPDANGDVLILERIEKEAVALYWRDEGLRAKQLYRYVEP